MQNAEPERKPPLTPPECVLRDFDFMPLHVRQLRDSRFAASVTPQAFMSGVLLWCAAWHQTPAGSLPDDDIELARFAGFGRMVDAWREVRDEALHGFELCSDGRLYHRIVSEEALKAYIERLQNAVNGARGNRKRWGAHTEQSEIEARLADAISRLLSLNPNAKVRGNVKREMSGGDPENIGGRSSEDRGATFEGSGRAFKTSQGTGTGTGTGKGIPSNEGKEESLLFDDGWSLDDQAFAIGHALGLSREEVEAAGANHAAWWRANRPKTRKTAQGWSLQFSVRLRDIAADPKQRARLSRAVVPLPRQRAPYTPPPGAIDPPSWWLALSAAVRDAEPSFHASYVENCAFMTPDLIAAATDYAADKLRAQLPGMAERLGMTCPARFISSRDLGAPQAKAAQ